MTRFTVPVALGLWCGCTILLAGTRWARRRSLTDRVAPYLPGHARDGRPAGVLSAASFRDVLTPVAQQLGGRLARLAGIHEDLGRRLERIHAPVDPGAFRLRQLAWTVVALAAGSAIVVLGSPPPLLASLLVLGTPTLTFLVIEQQLAVSSRRWQEQLFAELPIVAEQLGMLLSAGFSTGAALARVAERGNGAVATDLRRVRARIGQGLSETDALAEWADLARVDAVTDLVGVLALERETADLGRLVGDEAQAVRAEAQRHRIEEIERRSQQVWIPVTVAALVPGVLFLAVPFLDAMRLFGAA